MSHSSCKPLVTTFFLVLAAVIAPNAPAETEFKKVRLLTGISLDIPEQWPLKTYEKNRSFTVADVAKEKKTLLLAHSLSANAMISVSLGPKGKLTGTKIESITPEHLSGIKAQLIKTMMAGENDGSPTVVTMHDPAVVTVAGHPALMTGYLRGGIKNPADTWEVIHFLIPRPDLDVRVNLSWSSERDAYWRPVMTHVVESLVIY